MEQTVLQGVGVGLRTPHVQAIIQQRPKLGWFEVLADNYLAEGSLSHHGLTAVREHYPIALHSVGMSLGSIDPLDKTYLKQLQGLARRYETRWFSDHLCFVSTGGINFHDLLPLPYTDEAVDHTAARIRQVQDFLGERILIENVSSYVRYEHSTMTEAAFLNAVAEEADCWILLDLNNLYVSAYNHGGDVHDAFDEIQCDRVRQIHLGGFENKGDYFLDAHSCSVCETVWQLFEKLSRRHKDIPTLIEWDRDLPPFDDLLAEARRAERIQAQAAAA